MVRTLPVNKIFDRLFVSLIGDTKKPTQQSLKQAFVSLAEFIERPQADFKSALFYNMMIQAVD